MDYLNQIDFLQANVYGNTYAQWLVAGLVFLLSWGGLRYLKGMLVDRLSVLARGTSTDLDDFAVSLLQGVKGFFLIILSLAIATMVLNLPPAKTDIIHTLAVIAVLIQAAFWGTAFIDFLLNRQVSNRGVETDGGAIMTMRAVGFIGRMVLWVVIVLLILDNSGVDVTALVASLGIGGVAVALAVQNILSDLFASLSIVLDKPFVIGDFITVGDMAGTVEYIGMKSTRVRSLSGEQIVFSNADILKGQIRNYKRMFERRVVLQFGVTYQTPQEKLAAMPGWIRKIVEAQDKTRFDRAHLAGFGNSALNFEVVYFVLDPDYNVYMDIQQAIDLGIIEVFAREKVEFAYPTQTLFVQGSGGEIAVARESRALGR
ncbi:mechanosensitive ion channel family protein [Thermithiobacillus plumbiphilus]|uniref:Mechanosensitive ion channel family protein n=1 Tax=Thermithiobacillus plumbiphilus TaxID=1729899 RepID=A0ABU9D994_9PROT